MLIGINIRFLNTFYDSENYQSIFLLALTVSGFFKELLYLDMFMLFLAQILLQHCFIGFFFKAACEL
jgi:hypothetical protein